MNFLKHMIIFCVVCCAAAAPVKADLLSEFAKSQTKIEELINNDGDYSKLLKQMTIFAFEKQLKKDIKRKQSRIKAYLEEIEYNEETIEEIRSGILDYWFDYEESEEAKAASKLYRINRYLAENEEFLFAIGEIDEELAQYDIFLKQVQQWRNALN